MLDKNGNLFIFWKQAKKLFSFHANISVAKNFATIPYAVGKELKLWPAQHSPN